MTAHDPWTVPPPVFDPARCRGDAQIAAIKTAQLYEPPRASKTGKRASPWVGGVIMLGGALLGFLLFATVCVSSWILGSQSCSGLPPGVPAAPIVRGFEGG